MLEGACDPLFAPRPLGPFADIAHELARIAVEESLTGPRRAGLHRRILAALAEPPSGAPDLARLAHHAEGAMDAGAVVRHAPAAAAHAAVVGAHREAAAQYGPALRFADDLLDADRAELLERQAEAYYQTDDQQESIEALRGAIECHRRLGDGRREAAALSRLVPRLLCTGLIDEAERAARTATSIVEPLSPDREHAAAYAAMAVLELNKDPGEPTIEWGSRASAVAREFGDEATLVDALTSVGTMELFLNGPDARGTLEDALDLARRTDVGVPRILNNLAYGATLHRAHALADRYSREGLDYCSDRDLDLWRLSILGLRVRSQVDQGAGSRRWRTRRPWSRTLAPHPIRGSRRCSPSRACARDVAIRTRIRRSPRCSRSSSRRVSPCGLLQLPPPAPRSRGSKDERQRSTTRRARRSSSLWRSALSGGSASWRTGAGRLGLTT